MTYGALYLASLSALVATAYRGPAPDRDEAIVLVGLCGCLLVVGACLLVLGGALA